MSSSRLRLSLAASLAMASFVGSAAQAAEQGTGLAPSADVCAAETWPNISADCAGAKTPRKVRVISLDREAPATVPVPASVQAAYASKQADTKAGMSHGMKGGEQTAVTPMPRLPEDGVNVASDDAPSVAVSAVENRERKALARKQERAKKVARAQRQRERIAAEYGYAPPASYSEGYGYGYVAQPRWRGTRDEGGRGWFESF